MINAEEARRIAVEIITGTEKEQLDAVEVVIRSAVERGETNCYLYRILSPKVRMELEKLGYSVKDYSCQKEGTAFEISW